MASPPIIQNTATPVTLTSVQTIQQLPLRTFTNMDIRAQRAMLASISINDLKAAEQSELLKKYIALTVLMEARHATRNKSAFNITHQFRSLLASFGLRDLVLDADRGETTDRILLGAESLQDAASNGYRLFHINDMGAAHWNRKYFNMGIDENNNLVTKKMNTTGRFVRFTHKVNTHHDDLTVWDNLTDEQQLRSLFAEIKKQTTYDNTFGYDLMCAGMFCANSLIQLALMADFLTPLALIIAVPLSVAIYAAIIPPAMALFVMEHLIVNPIKWAMNALQTNEHEAFIEEVTSPAP